MPKTSNPIIIGDKEYHKYLIIWEDICGDSTITDFNEFSKMSVAKINTEAYILRRLTSMYGVLHHIRMIMVK